MYLAAFRVVVKILVLLQPVFVALFLLFNIISEITIDYYGGLILLPGPDCPLAPHCYATGIHIYISHKKDRPP